MKISNIGSILSALTQLNQLNQSTYLTERVKELSINEFVCLLDFITAEFKQFLRALDMLNNEALDAMVEQIMDAFTLKIGQILQADHTTIFLLDREQGRLWGKDLVTNPNQKNREIHIPINVGVAGYVAATGKTVNLSDAYQDARFHQEIDERPGYRTKTLLCMPIFSSSNQVVAVAKLLNKADGLPFQPEDEQRFQQFASSIGIILETCQSFYIAARNQQGASALLKATSCLGQSLDLQATLNAVMEQARRLMGADRSTLFMLSKEKGELWTKVYTADESKMMEINIPADRGIAGYVATHRRSLNIDNAYEDERFDPTTDKLTGYVTRNVLCMPVFNSGGELIGVTQLINKHQGSFTKSDEEFMQAFNIQAGMALENAKLFENVLTEKQYQKDILRSLSNAVISTDLDGRIVTINDAALELLGCPKEELLKKPAVRQLWETKLIGRLVWEIVPVENLKFRLMDSLQCGARHYVPEQFLKVGIYPKESQNPQLSAEIDHHSLAIPQHPNAVYLPWNEPPVDTHTSPYLSPEQVQEIERSINLTVNPLTNSEREVRGGLVVLEDISTAKRMKSTLYRYMNPGVVDKVMALGDDALMEGERRDVTILFSDIRGYTSMAEDLEATEVVNLLNKYFETMVEAVFSYEGTLDKFIGDALMAVFGAPLPLENHAWMAIQSALDMRKRLAEFNQRQRAERQPQFRIGIGISSGEVVSGNIGSQKRMDYTVIGDGVNLSARLESLTKEYGCDIIISEHTKNLCGDRLILRELDCIRVKGKQEAVTIYDLVGKKLDGISSKKEKVLTLYNRARQAYLKKNFDSALNLFQDAHNLEPKDRAISLYLKRIQGYIKTPPPATWDGTYTMTKK